jgi:hypothetical protein
VPGSTCRRIQPGVRWTAGACTGWVFLMDALVDLSVESPRTLHVKIYLKASGSKCNRREAIRKQLNRALRLWWDATLPRPFLWKVAFTATRGARVAEAISWERS